VAYSLPHGQVSLPFALDEMVALLAETLADYN